VFLFIKFASRGGKREREECRERERNVERERNECSVRERNECR